MLSYDLDKMLYVIPADSHEPEKVREILRQHPEIKFVSLMGIDIGGHDTDEKIPVEEFIDDMEKFLENGVQTDGSSVVLPNIAKLNNAKVDIIPDSTVNWFVDHNFNYPDHEMCIRDSDYVDSQGVLNLTEKNDGQVHLYAQWTPAETFIVFNDNADGEEIKGEMLQQGTFYDSETTLSPCKFERD